MLIFEDVKKGRKLVRMNRLDCELKLKNTRFKYLSIYLQVTNKYECEIGPNSYIGKVSDSFRFFCCLFPIQFNSTQYCQQTIYNAICIGG